MDPHADTCHARAEAYDAITNCLASEGIEPDEVCLKKEIADLMDKYGAGGELDFGGFKKSFEAAEDPTAPCHP